MSAIETFSQLNQAAAGWASAIATAAATMVALWLAGNERRSREEERRFEGDMVKQIVHNELDDLLSFLGDLPHVIDRLTDPELDSHQKKISLERVQRQSGRISLRVCRSERHNFRSLQETDARALARIIGGIDRLLEFVKLLNLDTASDLTFWDFCEGELDSIDRFGADLIYFLNVADDDWRRAVLKNFRTRISKLLLDRYSIEGGGH